MVSVVNVYIEETHPVRGDKVGIVKEHWAAKAAPKDLDGVEAHPRAHLHQGHTVSRSLLLVNPWHHLQASQWIKKQKNKGNVCLA